MTGHTRLTAQRFLAIAALASVFALAAIAAGCSAGSPAAGAASADGPVVATTVAPLADIARVVVGDRAEVIQLIPDGTDSHTYEPTPRDARDLGRADVVFLNGLHLEQPTRDLAEPNLKGGATVVLLGERTVGPDGYVFDRSFPQEAGDPNPHLWMNPAYAVRYAEIMRDTLSTRDPEGAATYRANASRFAGRIGKLDAAIRASIATIPAASRKLVTYHDSFAYFAPRYGMTVIGAVQPADLSEPTPREVRRIIDQVRAAGVPAVFGSEVFDSRVLEQVSAEAGARYVDELSDDALPGDPGDPGHTYVGMMVDDVRIMTRALGGDPAALDAVPVANE